MHLVAASGFSKFESQKILWAVVWKKRNDVEQAVTSHNRLYCARTTRNNLEQSRNNTD